MDNLIYRDYASWKIENHEMIETFQKNESVIYDRLDPVYTVLNHIYDLLVEEQKIDEDLDTIFIAGLFSFYLGNPIFINTAFAFSFWIILIMGFILFGRKYIVVWRFMSPAYLLLFLYVIAWIAIIFIVKA